MEYTDSITDNPLLTTEGLPPFDVIEPQHVVPAVRHVLAEAARRLETLEQEATPTWTGVMTALQDLNRPFEHAWSPVSHLFGVKNSPELREAYEAVLPEVVEFSLRVHQSRPIYDVLKAIKDGAEWDQLAETQRRIIDKRLLDAQLAGIGLDGAARERFNEIEQELSRLGTDFSNNVLDATKAFELIVTDTSDVDGLPESLLRLAAQSFNEAGKEEGSDDRPEATPDQGPWRFTLEAPSYVPFMKHCRNRDLRERMYRAFVARASEGETDNSELIPRILQLRQEKARLLGYRTFAEISLAEKMAESVDAVEEMLEKLRTASWEPARADLENFRQIAAESGCSEPLRHWDITYWSERLRERRFDFTDEQLRPYFPLERVLDGLFHLANRLFGIRIREKGVGSHLPERPKGCSAQRTPDPFFSSEPADGQAPVWHTDVRFFHVMDESGHQIAAFYLDPYSRPENKRGGAWMDDCLARRRIGDRLQEPVAHLVCNATPPVGDIPALMTFGEVETLFHEFGHGLQHMLTTVDEPDAAGIRGIEWDAVELPSQFLENWCYHKPTVDGISGHYETGEPLPDELFEKLRSARTFAAGSLMLRQLLFGLTDMFLHHEYDPVGDESVFDVMRRISEHTSVLPLLPEDRFLCAFQHIFAGGYAAGYYSYKWAEVLSADAFSAFEDAGLDNAQAIASVGRRFRDTILAQGGSRHPLDLFKSFRGRDPDPTALLRHNGLA